MLYRNDDKSATSATSARKEEKNGFRRNRAADLYMYHETQEHTSEF